MPALSVSPTKDKLMDAMERYADGDAAAFHEVFRTLAPVVGRCQRRWVGDDALAEDLVQETFLRVHRARDRYRRGAPVGPWVLTIARRLSIDALRRRAVAKERLSRTGEMPEPTPIPIDDGDADSQVLIEAVRAAVAALPEGQRAVVAMHKLDGRSLAEVAEALGIKEGAARVRAHRGYTGLRRLLAGKRGHR